MGLNLGTQAPIYLNTQVGWCPGAPKLNTRAFATSCFAPFSSSSLQIQQTYHS